MQAYLRVISGPDAGRTIDLKEGVKITIGRGEKSDTRFTDLSMSRLHCEFTWDKGKFHLVDLDSVSGTIVDGEQGCRNRPQAWTGVPDRRDSVEAAHSGIPDANTLVAAQKPARELKPDQSLLTGTKISNYEIGAHRQGRTGTIYKARRCA